MVTAIVAIPPVVGHVNSGIALSYQLVQGGWKVVMVSGCQLSEYVRAQELPFDSRSSSTLDFETDRSSANYRPHLEQLSQKSRVEAQFNALRGLIVSCDADVLIAKDCFAAPLVARATGISYVGFFTDGVESLRPSQSRQRLPPNASTVSGLRELATAYGLAPPRDPTDLLRSPHLNIVRGLPITSGPPAPGDDQDIETTAVYSGFTTYDARSASVKQWVDQMAGLARPSVYVTLGTAHRSVEFDNVLKEIPSWFRGSVIFGMEQAPVCASPELFAAPYIPNAAAMSVAQCVVHHGGHGTFLSAARAGIPQLVVPQNRRTQQMAHGAVASSLGIGMSRPSTLRRKELQQCVEHLLSEGFAARAAAFAAPLGLADQHARVKLLNRVKRLVSSDAH